MSKGAKLGLGILILAIIVIVVIKMKKKPSPTNATLPGSLTNITETTGTGANQFS